MALYDTLLIFGVLLFFGICIYYARHPAASFYHPLTIYLAMHGIVFTLRPILARIFDYKALYTSAQFQPSIADKLTVLLAADLALVVFAAASLALASRPIGPDRGNDTPWPRERLWLPFALVTLAIAPVAIYAAIEEWVEAATSVTTMVVDKVSAVNYNTSANGWVASSQLALAPLVAIFAWLTRFRWWSLVPFALFFLLRAGTGGRGPIIVAATAIVILYLIDRGRRWPEWRSAALILAAALAFNAIVADRGRAVREMFITDESLARSSPTDTKPFEHMDFANLEYFEFAVYAVPQRSGTYDYFLHNLQIFTEPIPRIWWKDKPLGPPIAMYYLADYGRPYGFTYSVPGVGWLAWGWPGVAIQAVIFALIFGGLHRRLARRPRSKIYLLVFAMMIASAVVSYRDGTLLTVVRVVPFYIGPIAVIWLLSIPLTRGLVTPSARLDKHRGSTGADWPGPAERRRSLAKLAGEPN